MGWALFNAPFERLYLNPIKNSEAIILVTAEQQKLYQLEMWANAQRDGRPAKYTGGALWSTPQCGWRPLVECHAVMLPRRETRWNLLGCPKLMKRPQLLVGWNSPYCQDMWGRYCCLTSFFFRLDTCLSCEDIARQSCAMVRFLRPVFSASRVQQVSDLHPKFALRPHHVWKYGRHPICNGWD